MRNAITIAAVLATAGAAQANIRITEWMYSGGLAEFWELTNVGNARIDLTGWSFDDDSATPGTVSLTGFGFVAPGESIVITEVTDAEFRDEWNLPGSVRVLGGNTTNFGRGDVFNLFDASNALVDRLTYSDQTIPGSIRTQNRSGVPTSLAALGADNVLLWNFADSVVGGGPYDLSGIAGASGVLVSDLGDTGNPGYFIPTPGSIVLAGVGLLAIGRRRR